jgi:hypothetical protein
MPPHLTEDELISHFYGDGRADQEAVVDAHLAVCQSCQAMWAEITQSLKMADAVRVPEPDAGFEQAMWARIQPALPERPPRRTVFDSLFGMGEGRSRPSGWLIPVTGLAAVLAIVAVVGRGWQTPSQPVSGSASPPAVATRAPADPAGRERVLLTALDDHFQRSEMLLVEVMNADAAPAQNLRFERQTADDLVESSRLYRQAAQQNGKVRLAQMLEDLESVLVEIARSPDQVDRKDFHALRARIDENDLLFKVRAMSKQIEDRQRNLSTE